MRSACAATGTIPSTTSASAAVASVHASSLWRSTGRAGGRRPTPPPPPNPSRPFQRCRGSAGSSRPNPVLRRPRRTVGDVHAGGRPRDVPSARVTRVCARHLSLQRPSTTLRGSSMRCRWLGSWSWVAVVVVGCRRRGLLLVVAVAFFSLSPWPSSAVVFFSLSLWPSRCRRGLPVLPLLRRLRLLLPLLSFLFFLVLMSFPLRLGFTT